MLPIDPGDGQGSVTPARPVEDIVPFQGRVPAQAMARGGTIIRPGAVAWGGMRDASDSGYSSCEAIERILASVVADPSRLPGLLAELATTQLWVPLPVRHRPFTDGTAVRLPLVEAEGEDFVPCFTSVQRLTAWVDAADLPSAASAADLEFAESGRRGIGSAGRFRQLDRKAKLRNRTGGRMLYLEEHLPMLQLGIFDRLFHRLHRGERDVRRGQKRNPFLLGPLKEKTTQPLGLPGSPLADGPLVLDQF